MQRKFVLVAALGVAACGSPAARKDRDPKAAALEPAVVNVPLNVPRMDAPPPKPKFMIIPRDEAVINSALAQGYALAGATMINGDAAILSQMYDVNAVLRVPDSTLKGGPAVVRYLVVLARAKSLADLQRKSQGYRIVDDSTLVDSGTYRMILKRTPKDSSIDAGRYATTWRARADASRSVIATQWVMLDDLLKPRSHGISKGAK